MVKIAMVTSRNWDEIGAFSWWKCENVCNFLRQILTLQFALQLKPSTFRLFVRMLHCFVYVHVWSFAMLMSSQFELEYVKIQDNEENNYFLISDFSSHLMFSCVFRMFNYLWAPSSSSSVIILLLFIIMDHYWA